jgi:PAS domain S-box-containing protein
MRKNHSGYRGQLKSGQRREQLIAASREQILAMPANKVRAMVQELRVHQIELEAQNAELRKAQLELAESRDRYSDLYEFAPIGYITLDKYRRIIESNHAASSLLGKGRRYLAGAHISRFVDRSFQDACHLHFQAAFDSRATQVCELGMRGTDGKTLVLRLESIVEQNSITKDIRCRTALIDVSEARAARHRLQNVNAELEQRVNAGKTDLQRRIEQLAEQSAELGRIERRFRTLVNNVPALFAYVDHEQRYRFVNDQCVKAFGRPADEIVGGTVAELFGRKAFQAIRCHVEAALRGEEAVYDIDIEHANGPRTLEVRHMPDSDGNGGVRGFFVLALDITERKQAEHALREREERLSAILNTATDGVITVDKRGIIIGANPAAERMFRYKKGELTGRNIKVLMPAPYRDLPDEKISQYLETSDSGWTGIRREASGLRKDGSRFTLEVAVNKIEQFGLFTGILSDITARKEAEMKLDEYRKSLRAMSSELLLAEEGERRRLAEDLHDNLGQAVFHALMTLDSRPFDDRTVQEIRDVLEKIGKVTSTLTYELSPIMLRQMGLWSALRWLTKDAKRRYGLQVRIKGKDRPVELDERVSTVLFRSVREILANVAKHAQTDFAVLAVRETGHGLAVSITDRGKGFNPDDESHKALGGRFGLFSVRERLEYLGGTFKIHSAPGTGTRVVLTVPRTATA